MSIQVRDPVVVGVPLDETTPDVLDAGLALARRLGTPLVPVHAIHPWPFPVRPRTKEEGAVARERILAVLKNRDTSGVEIVEPIIEEATATTLLLDVSMRVGAQVLVVGAGRGPTVASWLLGTVADRVVRTARCPVWLARGSTPGPGRPIVCPVDMSPHSRLGFEAALRMARRFEAPLEVITVIAQAEDPQSVESLAERAAELEKAAKIELEELIRAHDTSGVELRTHVVGGQPAAAILEAAESASLIVVASRAFDMLVPASLGDVTSRVVRGSHCSLLALRDLDPHPDERQALLERTRKLRDDARAALDDGNLRRAELDLRVAAALLPGHAGIERDLAFVLERAGRNDEAERHRTVARILEETHE